MIKHSTGSLFSKHGLSHVTKVANSQYKATKQDGHKKFVGYGATPLAATHAVASVLSKV